ncbi:hypothetical protein [Alienimonas sp. DA493]|uniref:hypothetical protein n=1 Tax=Alienimonas sp. DA493 TaxID=3373605 RepID=UPI0037541425
MSTTAEANDSPMPGVVRGPYHVEKGVGPKSNWGVVGRRLPGDYSGDVCQAASCWTEPIATHVAACLTACDGIANPAAVPEVIAVADELVSIFPEGLIETDVLARLSDALAKLDAR